MKRQRGQTLVEFALIAPLMFLMIFGMIYGGAMFMEYLDMSNEARTIARTIAIQDSETERKKLIANYNDKSKFTRFYTIERKAECTYYPQVQKDENGNTLKDNDGNVLYQEGTVDEKNPNEVIVKVTFTRDNKDLPRILYEIGFPPETIKPIEYHMKAE